jgi:hypothetical protein
MYFLASRKMIRLGAMLQIGLNSRSVTTLYSESMYTTPAPAMLGSASMAANSRGRLTWLFDAFAGHELGKAQVHPDACCGAAHMNRP